ncbi:MAG: NINE protein [Lachnospiraceae bacterium]|nr:NINE protein [Lachnospiraceae bacterium]
MKMKYCSYCGSLLDETTGVCPKCFGGMDAPKQEEQASELTSVPKVDLGDSPFASAPSTVIPTLTLDPFGNSEAQGSASQFQLEFGNVAPAASENASGPQLIMPELQMPGTAQAGPGIALELKPGISVEPEPPVAEKQAQEEAPAQPETSAQPEASAPAESDVFTQTPPAYSPKAQTRFEAMVAKIQADQERMMKEQPVEPGQTFAATSDAQEVQAAQQAQTSEVPQPQYTQQQTQTPQFTTPLMQAPGQTGAQYQQVQAAQQAQSVQQPQYTQQMQNMQRPQPMQAPRYSYGQAPQPMQAPNYGQQSQPQYGQQTSTSSPYGNYQPYDSGQGAYGAQMGGAASVEEMQAYMQSQKTTNYANPAYVDQEVTYSQPVDPRFSQTVNMNRQYQQAQVPMVYSPQVAPIQSIEEKSRTTAAILAILLGHLGIHKFYLNHPAAIAYLLITLCTCGMGGLVMWIISLIEGIGYLGMTDEEFKQKLYDEYNNRNKP